MPAQGRCGNSARFSRFPPATPAKAASSPPGTPHSCGSGTGIVKTCRLKPPFRHRIAWGGELDAALGVWVLARLGYSVAGNARITAEKVRAYAESVDLKFRPDQSRTRPAPRRAAARHGKRPALSRGMKTDRPARLDFLGMAHPGAERLECGSLLPLSGASKRPNAPASRGTLHGFLAHRAADRGRRSQAKGLIHTSPGQQSGSPMTRASQPMK
jgi:hypothetical protein